MTEDKLASLFKGFEDWRFAVLHDPKVEAMKAAKKASAPYERVLRILEKRIAEYSQRATGLSNQAFSLQNAATGLAADAVQKQAGKDFSGAAKNMMDAHQMMAQAQNFGSMAFKMS